MNRTDAFLQHFSSQPYDPVKAHEYYIRNRQLKGRSTSGMSESQKEAWAYSKNNITTDKKRQLESNKTINEQKIEALKKSATETRARISEKLKLLNERLTKKAEDEREQIADKLKEDIANIPPIPEGVSKEVRAILVERRNKKIAAIRNNSSKYASNLSSDNKESRKDSNENASLERQKIATDLKSAIGITREKYAKEKVKIIANYETIYQKEYDKVLTTVAGKSKDKSKGKGKNKGKGKGAPKQKKGGIIYYNGKGEVTHSGVKGMHWGIRKADPKTILNRHNLKLPKLSNYKGKLYFVSDQDLNGQTLYPRVAKNYLTDMGYEDHTTSRVSFAPSVDQCLMGLSSNLKGKALYVYEPEDIKKHDIYKPTIAHVPDSNITGELWITDPVKIKSIGKILVKEDAGEAGIPFKYGNNTAELYKWNYNWTDKQY